MSDGLLTGDDGVTRCAWAGAHDDYRAYHDEEWGFPVADDRRLFEKLSLEGFQSGLSWLTILRKRDAFRSAFAGFDAATVAAYGPADVARLLGDAEIVRHRGKIEAVIHNAGRVCELAAGGESLAALTWSFAPPRGGRPGVPLPATTPESVALARELRRRGLRFVGPTTAYAFMQSMGLVDDHLDGCAARVRAEAARDAFTAPTPAPRARTPAAG